MDWFESIITSSITRYVGIFGAYIIYLLIGSSIFDAIEIPAVQEREKLYVNSYLFHATKYEMRTCGYQASIM